MAYTYVVSVAGTVGCQKVKSRCSMRLGSSSGITGFVPRMWKSACDIATRLFLRVTNSRD